MLSGLTNDPHEPLTYLQGRPFGLLRHFVELLNQDRKESRPVPEETGDGVKPFQNTFSLFLSGFPLPGEEAVDGAVEPGTEKEEDQTGEDGSDEKTGPLRFDKEGE